MKKLLSIMLAVILGAGFIFAGDITISGSTTVFPIAQKAAEIYMDINPDVNISVRGGGSGVGIAALMSGQVSIANASRSIKTKEIKLAREKGINPYENIVANDGIAVVVNPDNPISGLTIDELAKIYTGQIDNWKELGGQSMPIVIISRDFSSGTFEVFKELAMKGGKVRDDALLLASNKAVSTTVADTPGAIGYVGFGYLSDDLKAIKVNGVMPTVQTVNDGSYKLSRHLYMYTNGAPKGEVADFINFILSEQGQEIAAEVGYIPLQ